jgi:hypothetical protein
MDVMLERRGRRLRFILNRKSVAPKPRLSAAEDSDFEFRLFHIVFFDANA